MDKIQIVVSGGVLDIDNAEGFALTYNVDDIKKLNVKNANHSKTIVLPGTKNNNKLLGNLHNINSTFTDFNPNVKAYGHILVNDIVVMKGYYQLKEVIKLSNSNQNGNLIKYNIVFYDDTVNIMTTIGDKMLTDLDMSYLNHKWGYRTILGSWGYTGIYRGTANGEQEYSSGTTAVSDWKDGYCYPTYFKGNLKDGNLANDGDKDYTTDDFLPSLFNKQIIQRIFIENGIEIGGDFFDNNETFANEVIPYNGDIPLYSQCVENINPHFKVGLKKDVGFYTDNIIEQFDTYDPIFHQGNETSPVNGAPIVRFDTDNILPFFDDAETPLIEGNWDNTLFAFSPRESGYFDIHTRFIIKIELTATQNWPSSIVNPIVTLAANQVSPKFEVVINKYKKTGGILSTSIPLNKTYEWPDSISGTTTEYVTVEGVGGIDVFMSNFDMLLSTLRFSGPKPIYLSTQGSAPGHRVELDTIITILKEKDGNYTQLSNQIKVGKLANGELATLIEGNTLNMNGFIPRGIKQIDLVTDVMQRYNLYITSDPTNPNKLIMRTRDKYYEDGIVLKTNWTKKLDHSKEQKIQYLTDIQNKKIRFTNIEDNDDFNVAYTKSTSDIYGEKKIEFVNSFANGESKIESIFSPTPLIYDKSENQTKVVSSINTQQPNNNIRILQWGGMIPTILDRSWSYRFFDDRDGLYSFIQLKNYAYAGHFNNPFQPVSDINWNMVPYVYYNHLEWTLDDGLYNNYWRNYMNQLANGKMLTAYFNINESDIYDIGNDLNTAIFVKDAWYVINKLTYNPTNKGTSKVELLRMNDPTVFIPTLVSLNTQGSSGTPEKDLPAFGDVKDTSGTFVEPIDFTLAPVDGTTFITDLETFNIRATDLGSTTTYTQPTASTPIDDKNNDGTTIDLVDGGYNVLRDPFADKDLNMIDGGYNEIRDSFSSGVWSVITALNGGGRTWIEATTIKSFPIATRSDSPTRLDASL